MLELIANSSVLRLLMLAGLFALVAFAGYSIAAAVAAPSEAAVISELRALAGVEGLELSLVLTGVRPEEAAEWKATYRPFALIDGALLPLRERSPPACRPRRPR